MTFIQYERDWTTGAGTGNRYQCRYDTDAFERMMDAYIDMYRDIPISLNENFAMNKTNDLQHYIDTYPACDNMLTPGNP